MTGKRLARTETLGRAVIGSAQMPYSFYHEDWPRHIITACNWPVLPEFVWALKTKGEFSLSEDVMERPNVVGHRL